MTTHRRINLFGGPGIGKSTLAARIFTHLKQAGKSIELVQEFVKQYVYDDRQLNGWDYGYTFAQQFEAERRPLQGGIWQIVTDSPLLLQCVYARMAGCPVTDSLISICQEFDREYPTTNLFLKRQTRFVTDGRWQQNEQEAVAIDTAVEATLRQNNIKYYWINPLNPREVEQWLNILEK